jgi:hypothetical protein
MARFLPIAKSQAPLKDWKTQSKYPPVDGSAADLDLTADNACGENNEAEWCESDVAA